jgi:hypothetical protein
MALHGAVFANSQAIESVCKRLPPKFLSVMGGAAPGHLSFATGLLVTHFEGSVRKQQGFALLTRRRTSKWPNAQMGQIANINKCLFLFIFFSDRGIITVYCTYGW